VDKTPGRSLLICEDHTEGTTMQHFDSERQYHNAAAYVYVGQHAFTLDELWRGVEAVERAGVPLEQISAALGSNWSATVVALALHNLATLRTLIREAGS
jgi:hypothetical protein